MAVMVLCVGVLVWSVFGFRCGAGGVFPFGLRSSVPVGLLVFGVLVRCWFRGWRFMFPTRGGGSFSGCFGGFVISFAVYELGFPPGVLRRPGEPAPPNPLQCVLRTPNASLHQSHAGRLLLRSGRRSRTAFPSATPITRMQQQSNANFGGRLSAVPGHAVTVHLHRTRSCRAYSGRGESRKRSTSLRAGTVSASRS